MAEQLDEKMLKLARMIEQGIPEKELANIFGTSQESLSAVLASEGYVQALAHVQSESFDKQELLNKGWDGIEEHAMSTVLGHLQGPTPDPDYALKAAALANKATRRGKHINEPIVVQPNMQSVIQLNATYVGKLEQNFSVAERKPATLQMQETNMLSVKGVKSLLGTVVKETRKEVVIEDLDGLDFVNA